MIMRGVVGIRYVHSVPDWIMLDTSRNHEAIFHRLRWLSKMNTSYQRERERAFAFWGEANRWKLDRVRLIYLFAPNTKKFSLFNEIRRIPSFYTSSEFNRPKYSWIHSFFVNACVCVCCCFCRMKSFLYIFYRAEEWWKSWSRTPSLSGRRLRWGPALFKCSGRNEIFCPRLLEKLIADARKRSSELPQRILLSGTYYQLVFERGIIQ